MDQVAKAILRYLFQNYQKAPNVLYSINSITDSYTSDPIAVSEYLSERKWIREQWTSDNNDVACRITVEGIQAIDPHFIQNRVKRIVTELTSIHGRLSLDQLFQNNIKEYAITLDVIHEMKERQLVSVHHTAGKIEVELTTEGWRLAENEGKHLFILMSVA
jgi:hypothetical protein